MYPLKVQKIQFVKQYQKIKTNVLLLSELLKHSPPFHLSPPFALSSRVSLGIAKLPTAIFPIISYTHQPASKLFQEVLFGYYVISENFVTTLIASSTTLTARNIMTY